MDKLAADVKLVVIVRRDRQRHGPNEAVLQIRGGRSVRLVRPDFNISRLTVAQIVTLDDAADAAGSGSTGPDNVWINRIGSGPTTLTAGDRVPSAARNRAAGAATARTARPAIRRIVLLVAVDVIRNPVVDRHVIHLRDRQLNSIPSASTRG